MYRRLHTCVESSTATNRLTIKHFAVQAEKVVVETSIDVGNIQWIF